MRVSSSYNFAMGDDYADSHSLRESVASCFYVFMKQYSMVSGARTLGSRIAWGYNDQDCEECW